MSLISHPVTWDPFIGRPYTRDEIVLQRTGNLNPYIFESPTGHADLIALKGWLQEGKAEVSSWGCRRITTTITDSSAEGRVIRLSFNDLGHRLHSLMVVFENSPIYKGDPLKSLQVRQILAELFELFSERLHESDKIMARKNLLVQLLGWMIDGFGWLDQVSYAFYRRERSESKAPRLVSHVPYLLQSITPHVSNITLPDSAEKEICRAVVVCRTFSQVQFAKLAKVVSEKVDLQTESGYSYNDPNLHILTAASLEKLVRWEKAHAEQSSTKGLLESSEVHLFNSQYYDDSQGLRLHTL
jgi:hypothetical protein